MNSLICALIEKTGRDNGFENAKGPFGDSIFMSSARHKAEVEISFVNEQFAVRVTHGPLPLPYELERSFPDLPRKGKCVVATNEPLLAQWLRRCSVLAQSLPNQVVDDYEEQVNQLISGLVPQGTTNTEVERMVRQRVGQDKFRQAMLDYWGSSCAVTGLSLNAALRASHAKPWAECKTDAERLNVYNGFLLSANLDALFDKFLISFDEGGKIMINKSISTADRESLGLTKLMRLRWVSEAHLPFLNYHRDRFLKN